MFYSTARLEFGARVVDGCVATSPSDSATVSGAQCTTAIHALQLPIFVFLVVLMCYFLRTVLLRLPPPFGGISFLVCCGYMIFE